MDITYLQDSLIIKAAKRWQHAKTGTGRLAAAADAELNAYGHVAADILDLCTAPFGFELSVREAVRERPLSIHPGASRESAEALRAEWETDIVRIVRKGLI